MEYKYEAFISYRHSDLDKFVAENLHKSLESYNLPKSIREKLNIKKTFRRVFRDREELPLTSNLEDPIIDALKNSKYLIVICSPRLKESLWCRKEIQLFKEFRGRKNIFCVLIEGEPSDSFPDEVLVDENGSLVEPLAADVRGKNKREILKKLKDEKLRLIAPMYNLDYDDLKQRNKLRKQKRMIHILIIVLFSLFLFTVYSVAMFIKINTQQNILAEHQALSLSKESLDYLNKDKRSLAILSAYKALTEFEYVDMPYTSSAEYALMESLGVYDIGLSYKVINELQTNGIVKYLKINNDSKYGVIYDESEQLTLFNTKTLKIIKSFVVKDSYMNEYSFSFIGNDLLSFINEKGNISIVDINGNIIKEIEKEKNSYSSLNSNDNYLVYNDEHNLYIYNIKENKLKKTINSKEKYLNNLYFNNENNYIFVFTKVNDYDINKEDFLTIHVFNLNGEEVNNLKINAGYINGVVTNNNNAYFLFNKYIGSKINMLVISYDFINNKINFNKTFENYWGSFIDKSNVNNNIVVVSYDTVHIINSNNGDIIDLYGYNNKIINIFSYLNKDMYLVFLSNGSVSFLNVESKNSVELMDLFEFNIKDYIDVSKSENGFILVPANDNRIILYEQKYNEERVKEDIKLDYISDDSTLIKNIDNIKEEYKIPNKSLVNKIFYDTNKELLFVNYTNNNIIIYDVKTKELLKKLDNVGRVYHYFGKDKYGRIYIGDLTNSYILDKKYDKVGHIKNLAKLEDDKVIILNNDEYYSLKIYKLDDLLKEAKNYLNDLNLLD